MPSPRSSSPDAPATRENARRSRSGGGERGRQAEKPSEVPPKGWRDVLKRTKEQISSDNLSIVAAGVAFFAFLAVVPAMVALVAIYALVSDPAQISSHLDSLQRVVPAEAMPLLEDQLTRIASDDQGAGWGALIGIVVALFSSLKGVKGLMEGLNIAYDEQESRGFIKLHIIALGLTVGGILAVALLVGLIAVLPPLMSALSLPDGIQTALSWLRWPVLALLFMTGLAVLYRYGPSRDKPRWRWLSWGAGAAAIMWLIVSALFSLYVTQFGSFDETYGSLGAVVVFLLWLQLSAFVILLGAELNCELERQTAHDTTEGQPEPMGTRGAYAADSLGESR